MKKKLLVDSKDNCVVMLTQYDPKRELHRIGNKKVFLKDQLESEFEIHRIKNINAASQVILYQVLAYVQRKKYMKTRKAIIEIQRIFKGFYYRRRYKTTRHAIVTIQRFERGRQARILYAKLLEEKRIEEERIREEQRRREEEQRREMERLEQERKMKELEELKRKREEEERIRREQEEERKRKEEERRLAELARLKELKELEEQKRIEAEKKKAEEEKLRIEEEMRKKEEEERRIKEEEEARIKEEEKEREKQEELERRDREAQEDALRQMAELDAQLMLEEALDDDEDMDTEDDTISKSTTTIYEDTSTVEHNAMEGYLSLKGGLINVPRKHWCVLKDDTLMWFRGKQKALKSGWILKKGGGSGTLSRRNWKRRWFVLKDSILTYHDSDQDGAKTLGTIDLRECRQIIDSGHKDNALSLVTVERTYHLVAESPQDWNDWYNILNRVHRANEYELKEMKEESANIKNAIGTIDTIIIESISLDLAEERPKYTGGSSYASMTSIEQSVYPAMYEQPPPDKSISNRKNSIRARMLDIPTGTLRRKAAGFSRQNGFNIITANRVYSFFADSLEEVTQWVDALDQSKAKQLEEGTSTAIEKGWILKRAPTDQGRDKRRWFILSTNSLDYYKSSDSNSLKLGSIVLNSLCTVIPPPPQDDMNAKNIGQWEFVINGRKRSYSLLCPSWEEANKWYTALAEVINNKAPVKTPYDNLIDDIMNETSESSIARIYRVNPLLYYTKQPLKMSLIPLPYGCCVSPKAQNKGYGTFHEEAIRIFSSLQDLEMVADPIAVTQGILQTCQDLKPLRDEIYCQLIKQTTGHEDPNSISALRHMQVLVCMCCTFLPTRKILRFLRFHLKRLREIYPRCEISKFAEFALESLKKTRGREFPPSREEIITLLGRRKLHAVVHCYGGGSCQIEIDSSTTSAEVVKILCRGLGMKQDHVVFALFEKYGPSNERSIEDRQIIADVLAKFERLKQENNDGKPKKYKWQLFFKIFCILHPKSVSDDSVEGLFLFEQTAENVLRGRYLLPEMTLCKLAALRLQYVEGDYITGSWIDEEIRKVFPLITLRRKNARENKPAPKKEIATFKGTIRKKITPWKVDEEEMSEQPKFNMDEEMSAIKSNVMTRWKEIQGTEPEDAQKIYMSIMKNWPGFGSTVFNVTSKNPSFPTSILSLGVSFSHVAIYRRDETKPLATYNYEDILSFGAPQPNIYRIIVQDRSPIQFETDKVIEIARLMKAYINEIVKTAKRKSAVLGQSLTLIGEENANGDFI